MSLIREPKLPPHWVVINPGSATEEWPFESYAEAQRFALDLLHGVNENEPFPDVFVERRQAALWHLEGV